MGDRAVTSRPPIEPLIIEDVPPTGRWQDSAEGIDWAFRNHAPDPEAAELLDEATELAIHFATWVYNCVPSTPDRSIALNDLRTALRSVKAAIACNQHLL